MFLNMITMGTLMNPEHRLTFTWERMNFMKKLALIICVTTALMGASIAMPDSDIPNLVGTWILESQGGVVLKGKEPRKETHLEAPYHATFKGEMVIKEQKGRVLYGTFSSPRLTENVIAVLSPDNKTFHYADSDGYLDGKLVDRDTIEYVYRHVSSTDTAAASGVAKRKK